jgi:hypothetical protein
VDVKEIEWEGEKWIHLAQDRDQWRSLVKTVINFFGIYTSREFLDKLSDYWLLKKDSAP